MRDHGLRDYHGSIPVGEGPTQQQETPPLLNPVTNQEVTRPPTWAIRRAMQLSSYPKNTIDEAVKMPLATFMGYYGDTVIAFAHYLVGKETPPKSKIDIVVDEIIKRHTGETHTDSRSRSAIRDAVVAGAMITLENPNEIREIIEND